MRFLNMKQNENEAVSHTATKIPPVPVEAASNIQPPRGYVFIRPSYKTHKNSTFRITPHKLV